MSDFWWAMLLWMIYIPLLFLWGFVLFDVFTRKDMGWLSKGLWAIGIVFLPLIGVLAYVIARPKDYDTLPGSTGSWDNYMPGPTAYTVTGSQTSGAVRDLESISRLHESGTISDDEYERLKKQVLAA
jgi:hypothetical protein